MRTLVRLVVLLVAVLPLAFAQMESPAAKQKTETTESKAAPKEPIPTRMFKAG
jgi:hypothetical protein